jgi:O-6-methylguanine DNA methyltransferase
VPSKFGFITLGVSERGLAMLHFGSEVPAWARRHFKNVVQDASGVQPFSDSLAHYFETGDIPDLPFDLRGTDFQVRCWHYLCEIPKGETRTYMQLARTVATEKAVRAVGQANGANPVAIFVPCHRVIASDGTLGGYGGGLPMKAALLDLEGARYKVRRTSASLFEAAGA